ncbi:hypothetical protein P4S68_12900 [Pseudoalteromonas sp. Hal099]
MKAVRKSMAWFNSCVTVLSSKSVEYKTRLQLLCSLFFQSLSSMAFCALKAFAAGKGRSYLMGHFAGKAL